jgi:hypothetical protein
VSSLAAAPCCPSASVTERPCLSLSLSLSLSCHSLLADACQANPKLPHSAGKLINLGRRLACSGDFRQSQQAVAGCQMGGFAAGPLDTAHAFFVLGT